MMTVITSDVTSVSIDAWQQEVNALLAVDAPWTIEQNVSMKKLIARAFRDLGATTIYGECQIDDQKALLMWRGTGVKRHGAFGTNEERGMVDWITRILPEFIQSSHWQLMDDVLLWHWARWPRM
jgi:hypothetical protein